MKDEIMPKIRKLPRNLELYTERRIKGEKQEQKEEYFTAEELDAIVERAIELSFKLEDILEMQAEDEMEKKIDDNTVVTNRLITAYLALEFCQARTVGPLIDVFGEEEGIKRKEEMDAVAALHIAEIMARNLSRNKGGE